MSFIQTNSIDTSKSYNSITIGLASPEKILQRSYGEVLKPETIRECVDKLTHSSKHDSILTATEEYGWFWYKDQPVNYQPNILPRSQDATPVVKETTGLYGISKRAYERYRCRVGATPYFYIIRDRKECIDLDTLEDFNLAEANL